MKKKGKTCDPGTCDYCQYIGEGDFLCDKYLEVVVEDWEPNENFLMCAKKKKRRISNDFSVRS